MNDKIRNLRFFAKTFSKIKNFARDVHFFFHENLIFSSLFISYHWMGGKGGEPRVALYVITVNTCACDRDIKIGALDLMNTVARVRPNLGHM